MKSVLDQIRFGKAFFGLVKDPTKTDYIFEFLNIGLRNQNDPNIKSIVEHSMKNADFRGMYDAKYLPPLPKLEDLATLSDGTLGREYYKHMVKNDLSVDFFPKIKSESVLEYLAVRIGHTHDIWHVLTEYDTTVVGELSLQGFALAQTKSGISASILASGLIHVINHHCSDIGDLMDAIWEGYQRGKDAEFLLGVPWEENWQTPITDLRAQVRVGSTQN